MGGWILFLLQWHSLNVSYGFEGWITVFEHYIICRRIYAVKMISSDFVIFLLNYLHFVFIGRFLFCILDKYLHVSSSMKAYLNIGENIMLLCTVKTLGVIGIIQKV